MSRIVVVCRAALTYTLDAPEIERACLSAAAISIERSNDVFDESEIKENLTMERSRVVGRVIARLSMSLILDLSLAQEMQAAPACESRFLINGETVYDKENDLTWQRCSVGQRWVDGAGCAGVAATFSFDAAQQLAGAVWRVPAKDELASLIEYDLKENRQKPTTDALVFPDMDSTSLTYWTNTPYDASHGWAVGFDSGLIYGYFRSFDSAVRLVRSGR